MKIGFLSADTREIIDFTRAFYFVYHNSSMCTPDKENIFVDVPGAESRVFELFLEKNYPGFIQSVLSYQMTMPQAVQIAKLIYDGFYLEDKRSGKKYIVGNEEIEGKLRAFEHLSKDFEQLPRDFIVGDANGLYIRKPMRFFYPILYPIKLSFDENAEYHSLPESEFIYIKEGE